MNGNQGLEQRHRDLRERGLLPATCDQGSRRRFLDGHRRRQAALGSRAEQGHRAGAAPVLYGFQLERRPDGVYFRPHLVDDSSGVGLQVVAADVSADGVPDILTGSQLGSMLFVTKRARLPNRPQ